MRGHVVVHVHYAGTGAAPDFTRIEHANVRFALSTAVASAAGVRLKEFSRSAPALAFAIDGEGSDDDGAVRGRRKGPNMRPHWKSFVALLRGGRARLVYAQYFCCFKGNGPGCATRGGGRG